MRLIQVLVPDELLDTVLQVLDERDIDYVLTDEEGHEEASTLAQFPLPEEAVQDVLDALRDAGLDPERYNVVAHADSATTEHLDELREQYTEGSEESLAFPELRERAKDLSPSPRTFVAMAVFSTVVATGGLLRDSAAALAGAMVIAPFFGTALSVGAGVACSDRHLLRTGVGYQLGGAGLVVATAAVIGWLSRALALLPAGIRVTSIDQVSIFLTPSALSVGIALAAGAAGALAVSTSLAVPLSGVAVAAAVVPSAAVVGVGLAWALPSVVAGALLQVGVNVLGVNVAAVTTLLALGYRPDLSTVDPFADASRRRRALVAAAAALLAVATAVALAGTAVHVDYERTVNREVTEVLSAERYGSLTVESVSAQYGGPLVDPSSPSVTVVVHRPAGERYPALPDRLERQVERATGRDVALQVRYLDYASASNGSSGS